MPFVPGQSKIKGSGIKKGDKHKVTERIKNAAVDLLQALQDNGSIAEDIAALSPAERINAYIRLLSIIMPKNVDLTLSDSATITIEEHLALLAAEEEK